MPNLTDFVEDCDTLRQVFEKAKCTNKRIHLVDIEHLGSSEGIQVMMARRDYAIMRFEGDDFRDVPTTEVILPYGASIGYTIHHEKKRVE